GYGALRYLADAEGLCGSVPPQVSFNYLGQFDRGFAEDGALYRGDPGALDADVSPEATRAHLLDVVARIQHKCLELTWDYSTGLHLPGTVEALAGEMVEALREIVAHCAEPGAGGRTPSDFPLARMDQAAVDRLVGDGSTVEDLYPLTPLQAGMLFHSLVDGDSGVYVDQARLTLDGVGDPARFATAWQCVV